MTIVQSFLQGSILLLRSHALNYLIDFHVIVILYVSSMWIAVIGEHTGGMANAQDASITE